MPWSIGTSRRPSSSSVVQPLPRRPRARSADVYPEVFFAGEMQVHEGATFQFNGDVLGAIERAMAR
jgi:hypothetical protein